jgi:hypothetical protein
VDSIDPLNICFAQNNALRLSMALRVNWKVIAILFFVCFTGSMVYKDYYLTIQHPSLLLGQSSITKPSNHLGSDLKVMVYVTTHMSVEHIGYLKTCWPKALEHSELLRKADYVVYLQSHPSNWQKDQELVQTTFRNQNLTIHLADNPGYQEGAMAALRDASKNGWFTGYDWIIRLNPDVILRNETFLINTMMNDPNATAMLINCKPNSLKVHTDFFAIKPSVLPPNAFQKRRQGGNAEGVFTKEIRKAVLNKGGHRWIPSANPVGEVCRAGSFRNGTDKRPFSTETPITHAHFFNRLYEVQKTFDNVTCPIPFY